MGGGEVGMGRGEGRAGAAGGEKIIHSLYREKKDLDYPYHTYSKNINSRYIHYSQDTSTSDLDINCLELFFCYY